MSESQGISPSYSTLPGSQNSLIPAEDTVLGGALVPSLLESGALPIVHITSTPSTPLFDTEPLSTPEVLDPVDLTTPKPLKPFRLPQSSLNTRTSNEVGDTLTGSTAASPLVGTTGTQSIASTTDFSSNQSVSTSVSSGFAVMAQGTVTMNEGDFDGNPTDLTDDALIYAGSGFTINGNPVLPVQRDAAGNPLRDANGRLILVDRAVAVAAGYSVSNASTQQYANLLPPQIVEQQTVTVPAYSDLRQQELSRRIPAGTPTVTFNAQQNPLNSAADWSNRFPPPGTATNPTVVQVTGGGLNVPAGVNLSHTIIQVAQGDINFNGSGHTFTNVMLVTNSGNINLSNLSSTDLSAFASGSINMNNGARFGGIALLASESTNGSVNFNGATTTTDSTSNLRVVSQGSITFNAAANTRGAFLSVGNFTYNNTSTLLGSIGAKGNVIFNAPATVIAASISGPDTTAPELTVALTQDTAPGGTTNTDRLTFDPTITGSVTDSNAIVEFRAGFGSISTSDYTDILASRQANGSFTLNRTQLEQIYGGVLADGTYTLNLIAKDQAGNSSSSSITFTLDTTTATPTLSLVPTSDSGQSNSDRITQVTTPQLAGTADVGTTVRLYSNGVLVGQGSSTGTWQITTSSLANGVQNLTAIAEDNAGNLSAPSTPLPITVDALLPQLTLTTPLTSPLRVGATLTGTVDGTGSAVTALSYRFDQRPDVAIAFDSNGSFNQPFDLGGLTNGVHTLTLSATDLAGNITVTTFSVTVELDIDAPVITAALANDTAANNSINTDRLTSDPTITGTVIDTNGITGFRAGFDNTPLASFVDILADLTSDRRFTLNRARLETIYGGSLPDGSHVLRLQSQDEYGNLSGVYEVAFTLDTTPPATPTIDLAPTSDTGTVGDRRTTATVVTLVGQSDPGVRVTLEQTGDIALADGEGRFTFTDVALVPGDNSFTVRASDGAGNLQTSTTIIYRSTPPNTLTLTSNQVLENSPTGTLIGQLVTSDPDAGDTSTLTLVDDAGGRFQLVGDQLQVSDSTLLDFESGSSYAITVRSTDGDGLSLTETFTITLTNANEAPNFTSTPITVGQTGTLYQYTIVTTDPDTGDTRTIRASALPEWLSLVDNGDGTAVLQGLPVPGSYPIGLVVEDAAGLSATQTFTLTATLPLMEGAVFTTGQTVALTIPTTPSILRFKINTQFDGADPDSINDAFEVALVDASGRSLVHTIGTGRDAFFNWSEGEGVALGAGASYDAATGIVSLNLTGSPTGAAQLVFRLVNNDSDTTTAVQVSDLALTPAPAGTLPPVQVGNPAISLATPLATPDFTQLSDVSPSVQVEYHRTTFDPETEVLYADISLRNLGEYSTNVPLLVAVTGISDPTVQLLRPDGTTPNGIPYYDFSQLITTGRLDPNAETAQRSLVFYNPNGVQFTYELIVLAQLNRNPVVETAVATEVVVGQPYRYSVGATDLDDDTLTYTLASAPDGMTVNTQTGLVTWNTTGVLPRNYSVEVQVSDGRGGTAQQSLTVAVILPVPNRLPLVTSTPPVDARVNAPYTYQIAAQDPDGDALTYTLASGPAGMQVNATTGLVSWTPSDGQQGIQAVVVQVSDNRGESTQQAFNILTRLEQGNHNPFITSTPETTVYTQSPYRYQVQAVDPDGDTLSYALLNPPQGMTIHPTSGLITWTPTLGSGSIPPVTVQVRDGRGGVQEQVLTLTVEPTTGEIRGQIWEDRNRNGQIDASERGLTGVQVYLDTNNNQQLDAGEVTTLVDETGHYRFTGLAAGSYLVREVVPASFTLTSPLTTQLGSNVITNGSFETLPQEWTPTFFGNFFWINVTEDDPAQRQIPGWQVLNRDSAAPEDVDITPQSLWPASDGQYSIELEGYYGGTVAQTFATIPGLTYRLTFDHAGHPFFGDQFKTVEVRIGNRVERFTYDRFDPSVQAGFFNVTRTGWREASLEFTATDTQTTLQFGKYRVPYAFSVGGPAIDDVAVRPVIPTGSYLVTLAAGQRVEQIDFGNAPAATAPNNQPQITSAFPTQTEAGQFFQYDAQAIDPDQQSLTYDLPVRPQGMTIDPQTGRVLWTPTTDQVGLYNVVLRVRDGQRGVDLQTFQLEVTPLNADPVFTSVLSTEVRPQVGKPFTYQAVALDLDGDSITYSLAPIVAETFPTGVTINPTTGVVSWTPTALGGAGTLNGEIQPWQITIQASDGKGGIALQTLDLVVEAAAPNQAPTILSSPRTSTRPGSPYFYQVRATDIDGDPLTYNLDATSLGKGMQIQNGLLVWTPSANQFGAHAVVVQVSDGIHTVNQAFTLTVTNPVDNAAPVITSTPNLVANLGREYQYNLTGTDADGDYRLWSLSQGPSGMVIDAQRGTLRWTPTLEQVAQTHTIVVRLTDALGSYVEQRFDLIATGVNVPPVIRSIPITQAGVGQEYVYTAVATDAENDALTFSLPFRQPGGMTISRSGIIRWTPAANQQGSHVIDVRVTDSRGGESTQTFTIEVGAAAVNRPPVITSSPILRAPTGASYQYTVTATDPDVSDALIYQLLERPDGMQINATSGEITWTTPVTGNHRVVVSVSDAGGLNAYQSFVLAAQANAAPTLQSTAPTQATPGVTYAYDIRATDTDGNSFTYALDPASLSRGMILDALGRLRWAPSTTDLGVHPVVVTVTDAYGASVQQPFDITVTADTQAPRVSLVASTSQVTVGSQVTFQARATDNVDVAGLQLLVGNQAVVLDANGFATVTLNQTGTITARARASDTAGNQTEVTTAVVVSAANAQAPIARLNLSGIADGVITSATNLIGTVDDPDSNSVTYTVEAAPIAGGEWRTIFTG
ncbi:DUF642 domain-containing protein, partial [Oscillatoria sp. FACHB-1407]|uniref:putative Ig domain-containing protein n=1 Tax=Oscillatoria sp. FACHB-1407 TaxID=2692847 RepID=UPI0016893C84